MFPFMREKFAKDMHLWEITFITTKEKSTHKWWDSKLLRFCGFDIFKKNNTELRKMWIVCTLLSILADLILTYLYPEALWNSFSHPHWWDTQHVQDGKSSLLIHMVQGHDSTTEKGKKAQIPSVLCSLLFEKPLQHCKRHQTNTHIR